MLSYEIKTEIEMKGFCSQANKFANPFLEIEVFDKLTSHQSNEAKEINEELIQEGRIGKGSHLQQGVKRIEAYKGGLKIEESPLIYPSQDILDKHPHFTGPMTGNLSNCYDPQTKRFLFHMRGKDISAPFGFQAGAAGMGKFREHPQVTAKKELAEEAGLQYPETLFEGYAVDVLPFMKSGKIPQPLFSFGFANDLSGFYQCHSLDGVAKFEDRTKQRLKEGELKPQEAYHFTLPYKKIEPITGELDQQGRFYGPIYDSTMNFIRALRKTGEL